ncbi:Zinc finger protein 628, partial [Stegodyphus mimosarum]
MINKDLDNTKDDVNIINKPTTIGLDREVQNDEGMRILYNEQYYCSHPLCSYRTSSRRQYAKHRLIHSNARPYICFVCNHSFTRSDSLRQHLLIHSGEKPYSCKFCPMRFTHRNSRNRHKMTHLTFSETE